jgi:hypothetical protein
MVVNERRERFRIRKGEDVSRMGEGFLKRSALYTFCVTLKAKKFGTKSIRGCGIPAHTPHF